MCKEGGTSLINDVLRVSKESVNLDLLFLEMIAVSFSRSSVDCRYFLK